MQFIGKPTSRPHILRKSIEKQKWWEAAGMTIFWADTGSEELDAPTGLGWDAATGPLPAENKEENLCAFSITKYIKDRYHILNVSTLLLSYCFQRKNQYTLCS